MPAPFIFPRMKGLYSAALTAAILLATAPLSRGDGPEFRHITSREGLKFTWILDITRDSEDFVWFASIYGAHRYDGHGFVDYTFEKEAGDVAPVVNSMTEASDKSMFFSTGRGLWKMERSGSKMSTYLDSLDVRGMVETSSGEYWAATRKGIWVKSPGTDDFERIDGPGDASSIIYDSRGYVWVGTSSGQLLRADTQVRSFTTEADGAGDEIHYLLEDSAHNIWLCTLGSGARKYNIKTGGVSVYDTASGHLENNLVRQAAEGPDGTVYLASEKGLARIFPDGGHDIINSASPWSLNDDAVYSVYVDCDANLWVGTFFGGINVSYSGEKMFSSILSSEAEYSTESKVVSDIIPYGDGLMVATENDGIYILGPGNEIRSHTGEREKGLKTDNIHSLCYDSKGNLWAGTYYGGLYLLPSGASRFRNFTSADSALTSDNIYCVREDSKGRIWIGTQGGGLYLARDLKLEKAADVLPGWLFVWDIIEDAQGDLWFACYGNGVWRMGSADKEAHRIDLPVRNVISLCELSDGRILATTEKEGLAVIDYARSAVSHLTRATGFPEETVYCAQQAPDGSVWLSTNHGLLHSGPDLLSFSRYTMNDGLPANRFNYNAGTIIGEELFFGSTNGLVAVNPVSDGIGRRRHTPRFTEWTEGEKGTGYFSATFSGRVYSNIGETFRYRMKGADTEFHDLGEVNHVEFVGLPPGNYILEVESICDGDVSTGSLPIRVRPLWWQSKTAIVIFVLLGLTLLGVILRLLYQNSIHSHVLEVERLEREKEREINETKMRFIINDPVSPSSIQASDGELLREITDYIMENISEPDVDISNICSHVGMSRSALYRKMKSLTGKSTGEFIQSIRMKYAAGLLSDGSKTVAEVAYAVGFSDPYYFSRAFKQVFGAAPAKWRKTQDKH